MSLVPLRAEGSGSVPALEHTPPSEGSGSVPALEHMPHRITMKRAAPQQHLFSRRAAARLSGSSQGELI